MDSERVFKASPKKALRILALSIAFVVVGVWLTGEKPFLGWLCVGFFGLGIPVSLFMMRKNTTYLKLDREGFEVVALSRSFKTRWTEVEAFRLGSLHGNKMIAIDFRPEYSKQRVGRAIASAVAGMESAIADHYNAPIEEVFQALNAWKERFGHGGAREVELWEPPLGR